MGGRRLQVECKSEGAHELSVVIATKYLGSTFDGSGVDMVSGTNLWDQLNTAMAQRRLLALRGHD